MFECHNKFLHIVNKDKIFDCLEGFW